MQSMQLADDLFAGLRDGSKSVSIRKGKREVELGLLTFVPVDGTCEPITVDITQVIYVRGHDLPDELAQKDGASSAAEMLQNLRRFYPDLKADDTLTCVRYIPTHLCKTCGDMTREARPLCPGECQR